MTTAIDFKAALDDPAAHFAEPAAVMTAEGLDTEQKIAILRQWAYDQRLIAIALEEGMPGNGAPYLQRIKALLAELDPSGDRSEPFDHRATPTR